MKHWNLVGIFDEHERDSSQKFVLILVSRFDSFHWMITIDHSNANYFENLPMKLKSLVMVHDREMSIPTGRLVLTGRVYLLTWNVHE